MQRLYTTFPHGLPGVGLLFLRTAIGVRLIVQGSTVLLDPHVMNLGVRLLAVLTLWTGVSFVLGFLTPLMAAVLALTNAVLYLWHPAWASSFLDLTGFDSIVVTTAIALLGPGAISLDARFFGRRKIVIPRVARS